MSFLKNLGNSIKKTVENPSRLITKPITLSIDSAKYGYEQIAPTVAAYKDSASGLASEIKKSPELFNSAASFLGVGDLASQGLGFLDRKEVVNNQPVPAVAQQQAYQSQGSSFLNSTTFIYLAVAGIGVIILAIVMRRK